MKLTMVIYKIDSRRAVPGSLRCFESAAAPALSRAGARTRTTRPKPPVPAARCQTFQGRPESVPRMCLARSCRSPKRRRCSPFHSGELHNAPAAILPDTGYGVLVPGHPGARETGLAIAFIFARLDVPGHPAASADRKPAAGDIVTFGTKVRAASHA